MHSDVSIMWFRRDLRLADNQALLAAAADGRRVVPLFVVDPAFAAAGAPRLAAMGDALQALDESVNRSLVFRHGDPVEVVAQIAAEVGATNVFVSRDYGPYGRRRDQAVSDRLRQDNRKLVGKGSPYAVPPGTVRKADGSPYAVFTPFSRSWRTAGWSLPSDAPNVDWLGSPTIPCDGPPTRLAPGSRIPLVSERSALGRWNSFTDDALDHYDHRRDVPAVVGTSLLSADLRWGTIHPRQLLADLQPTKAHDVFASELAWRDFYADVLFQRPDTAWQNLNRKMDDMAIDTDQRARDRFGAWQQGMTGYPIVDAGMRQLLATGWMHNRVRMIVASFLVKDLHVPWQWGARHFMGHLVDGDLASNNHGWQWAAGTGTDAAPYFRVFNPTSQSQRFDPDGDYLRQWIPELASLDKRTIHQPGLLRPAQYPSPIVDHAADRVEALARYKAVTARYRQ